MFKRLREKLDETGIKNKILDYAANANASTNDSSAGSGGSQGTAVKKEVAENSSQVSGSETSPEQDVTMEDWSVKGEPPPIGWSPPPMSSPGGDGARAAVLPSDTEESEADDINASLDSVSKEQLLDALKKWHARYQRAKAKCIQRGKAYQELNYEKEKIQGALSDTQDKLLRRQAELREQCLLEQQAKAHMEQNLRITLEEKDQLINVLETKVQLLKEGKGNVDQTITYTEQTENVEELQKKVKRLEELLNRCRQTLNSNKEQSAQLKKQLEEKDASVKQSLEQELKLREHLLQWEQESKKECSECLLLKEKCQSLEEAAVTDQEQLQKANASFQDTERNHDLALQSLEHERTNLEQQLAELQQSSKETADQVKVFLEQKEGDRVAAVQAYQELEAKFQEKVKAMDNETIELRCRLEKVAEDKKTERTELEDQMRKTCQSLEEELQEKCKQVEILEAEQSLRASDEMQQLIAKCKELQIALNGKGEESDRLQQSWQDQEKELVDTIRMWEEKYNAFESRFEEYENRNQSLEEKSCLLEQALQGAREGAQEYVKKFEDDYAENLKRFEDHRIQLEATVKQKEKEDFELISTLNNKCTSLEQQMQDQEESYKEAINTLEKSLAASADDNVLVVSKLQTNCHTIELQLDSLKLERAVWQEKESQLKGNVQSLETELSQISRSFEVSCADLNEKLEGKTGELLITTTALNTKTEEMEHLVKEKNEILSANKSLESKLQSMANNLRDVQKDSSQTIEDLKARCSKLQAELDDKNNNLCVESNSMRANYEILEQQLIDKDRVSADAIREWKDKCSQFEEYYQKTKLQLNEREKLFQKTVSDLQSEVEGLKGSMGDVQQLTEKCAALEDKLKLQAEESLQNLSNLDLKCKTLQLSLTEKENDFGKKYQELEDSCNVIRIQLKEQSDESNLNLQRLSEQCHLVEVFKQKENDNLQKIQKLEERCFVCDQQLKVTENESRTCITDLERKSLGLQERCESAEREHLNLENRLDTAEKALQGKIHDFENYTKTKEESYQQEKIALEEQCQLLKEQLKGREDDVSLTVRGYEDKCLELQQLLHNAEKEHLTACQEMESKSQHLETLLKGKDEVNEQTVRDWESRCLELENKYQQEQLNFTAHIKTLENQQAAFDEQSLLLKDLSVKCKVLEDEIAVGEIEKVSVAKDLENKCEELENFFKQTEMDKMQNKKLQDEHLSQIELLKEAEGKCFDKIQSLEDVCQRLESQLEEREESSSAVINHIKEKCRHLESALLEQSNQASEGVTNLQEKCQRLEIQLKDIEEDSSQTIRNLEEKCLQLQTVLQDSSHSDNRQLLEDQCLDLHGRLKELELENANLVQSLEETCLTLETEKNNRSSDSITAIEERCRTLVKKLEEQEVSSNSLNQLLKDKSKELEDLLLKERDCAFTVLQRLKLIEMTVFNSGSYSEPPTVHVGKMVPSDWQIEAEAILAKIETALSGQDVLSIHPQLEALVGEWGPESRGQPQVKQLLQKISRQMQEKDHQHHLELREARDRMEEVEQKFIHEEDSQVQQLAQQVAEQSAANEDIREHFLLQIQEKDAEITALQKQLLGSGVNKKSDWDNAWDMEEDELCNNAPVQNIVTNELQAVMNDNKADLDQLERFLSFPSINTDTPKSSLEPTEYEYLRNVLLAYMTGREPMVMAKVIAAVLRFPEEDTQEILRREAFRNTAS